MYAQRTRKHLLASWLSLRRVDEWKVTKLTRIEDDLDGMKMYRNGMGTRMMYWDGMRMDPGSWKMYCDVMKVHLDVMGMYSDVMGMYLDVMGMYLDVRRMDWEDGIMIYWDDELIHEGADMYNNHDMLESYVVENKYLTY